MLATALVADDECVPGAGRAVTVAVAVAVLRCAVAVL